MSHAITSNCSCTEISWFVISILFKIFTQMTECFSIATCSTSCLQEESSYVTICIFLPSYSLSNNDLQNLPQIFPVSHLHVVSPCYLKLFQLISSVWGLVTSMQPFPAFQVISLLLLRDVFIIITFSRWSTRQFRHCRYHYIDFYWATCPGCSFTTLPIYSAHHSS